MAVLKNTLRQRLVRQKEKNKTTTFTKKSTEILPRDETRCDILLAIALCYHLTFPALCLVARTMHSPSKRTFKSFVLRQNNNFRAGYFIGLVYVLKQLFALALVKSGEYLPPLFTSTSVNNC